MLAILYRCFLLFVGCAVFAAPAFAESFSFLALADIHFDPFATCYASKATSCPIIQRLQKAPVSRWSQILAEVDTGLPAYRQDTNYLLLQKTLQAAHRAAVKQEADFVVVLGDTVGHDFHRHYRRYAASRSESDYQSFVNKTLEFVNAELAATFTDMSVFMVTGNNDTYSRNYQSVPDGLFFHRAGALWSTLIKNPDERAMMRREFAQAGYYAIDVPDHSDVRLIVLNSVLFSDKSMGKSSAKAALLQLNWLHQVLQAAKKRHQQVIIALHIPPRVDIYATHRWRLFTAKQFWRPIYLQRFQEELAAFYPEIIDILAGHLHYDWTQALEIETGSRREVDILGVPSVSPIFRNDPSFKVYHYTSGSRQLSDVYTYFYPIHGRGVWSVQRTVE